VSVDDARVSPPRMALRLGAIATIAGVEAARTLPAALAIRAARGRAASRAHAYRGLVRGLQALGPTFVKGGQVFAPRADALPAELCAQLSRLHDAVAPMSRRQARRALRLARAARPALADVDVDLEPVGSGSIACVYRGELPDGDEVALKLKRPGIDRRMQADLALIVAMARAGQRLPKLRGMPMADLFEYLAKAVLGQLDFDREARHAAEIRASLAGRPDVLVPAVRPGLSAPNCLAFDYLPSLDATAYERVPAAARRRLAIVTLDAVHKLFFEDGLVHCDLHPGNLYVTRDHRVVILDAGYTVRLPDGVRRLIGEFFERLADGDGRRCGEIVLESAVNADATTDVAGFVADFDALVQRVNDGFDMPVFGDAVYELQRRYGIYAASDFAFPLMSLAVVEGTVNRLAPDLDFRMVGGGAGKGASPLAPMLAAG